MNKRLFRPIIMALTLSLLASVSPFKKEDHLRIKQGFGTVYNIGFEQGLQDIQKIAQNSKEKREDCWFWDGEKWTDVGKTSLYHQALVDSVFFRHLKKRKENLLVHNHQITIHKKDTIGYSPPSGIDYISTYSINKNLKDSIRILEGVVDGKGLWTYSINDTLQEFNNPDVSDIALQIMKISGSAYSTIIFGDQMFYGKHFDFPKEYEKRKQFVTPEINLEFRAFGGEK